MQIGDTLYRFDGNRVYREPGKVYRAHFEPLQIVGENRVSWILEHGWKVNKKTGRGDASSYAYGGRGFFTKEAMEDDIWDHENRHKISGFVLREATIAQLRQAADLIGYSAFPPDQTGPKEQR